jgi:hypothetical protein
MPAESQDELFLIMESLRGLHGINQDREMTLLAITASSVSENRTVHKSSNVSQYSEHIQPCGSSCGGDSAAVESLRSGHSPPRRPVTDGDALGSTKFYRDASAERPDYNIPCPDADVACLPRAAMREDGVYAVVEIV